MPLDLDAELDRLYGVELAEFVGERTRLARALRNEGRRAEADQVKELRKPSISVWAVNQLARRRRKEVDLLLDAGRQLAAAQRALLTGGDRSAFEQAGKAERDALKRLSDAARSILAERASSATMDRVTSTLRAAAVSDAARPDLARGRLTGDVDPVGFEAFSGSPTGVAPPKAKARPDPKGDDRAKREQAERQEAARRVAISNARAELKAAREREKTRVRKLDESERAERATRSRLEQAERATEHARADHQEAVTAVEAAHARLEAAERPEGPQR